MTSNALRHLCKRAEDFACATPLYGWHLDWSLGHWSLPEGGSSGAASLRSSQTLAFAPPDPWQGDSERGRLLCAGIFDVYGAEIPIRGTFWSDYAHNEAIFSHLHGFSWLRDLRALGLDDARRQARGMIAHWIAQYRNWDSRAWSPDITGRRIKTWIGLYGFFGESADDSFQSAFFAALLRQAAHLSRSVSTHTEGVGRIHAISGLVYAGLAFEGRRSWLAHALRLLEESVDAQIDLDGGHVSRNPADLVQVLQVCVDVRAALMAAGVPVPPPIQHAMDRMGPALRFFRYNDKGLAVFNGAQEGERSFLDMLLSHANVRGKILRSLPGTGYSRMALGRAVVMVDTASPPAPPHDARAHVAPLAFEFSFAKDRIFVNCGTHPLSDSWREALRGTAAHTTLCLDHRNACEILSGGHVGRKARKVIVSREENGQTCLLDVVHDGYVTLNGITHRRRLFLAERGEDFRGEDILTCTTGITRPVSAAIRFHLHPRVLVSLVREGCEAILCVPGGSGWRFQHTGGSLSLEEGLYLGEGHMPRKTHQLVIHTDLESDHTLVKWALRKA